MDQAMMAGEVDPAGAEALMLAAKSESYRDRQLSLDQEVRLKTVDALAMVSAVGRQLDAWGGMLTAIGGSMPNERDLGV